MKPTEDGLYWLLRPGAPAEIVKVWDFASGIPVVSFAGTDEWLLLDDISDGKWAGPLFPPAGWPA